MKLVLFSMAFLTNCCVLKSQDLNEQKTFKNIKIIDSTFLYILDSLRNKEKVCDYYDSSFIWSIAISELKDNSYFISLSMTENLQEGPKYYKWYFYLDNTLYLVGGNLIDEVFIPKEKNKLDLKLVSPYIEDYSTWHFHYKNEGFYLIRGYSSCSD